MKQRYCKATIYDDRTKKTRSFENMAMSFNIDMIASVRFATGTFAIAGLSSEAIEEYTMFIPNFLADGYFKKLKIEAGYIENGKKKTMTIFDGYIREALPQALPERWLVCDVMGTLNTSFEGLELQFEDVDLYNLVAEIAIAFGFSVDDIEKKVVDKTKGKVAKEVMIDNYFMEGNLQQHLNKIQSMFYNAGGYRVWFSNGIFYIGDFQGNLNTEAKTFNIGGKNGLLIYDVVKPDVAGVNVKTEISDSLQLYDNFKLKSKLIPSANGTYTILSLNFVGETRGNSWYCNVRGINPIGRVAEKMYGNATDKKGA